MKTNAKIGKWETGIGGEKLTFTEIDDEEGVDRAVTTSIGFNRRGRALRYRSYVEARATRYGKQRKH